MTPQLRPPQAADFAALATWVPDAEACLRWAGPKLPFPFTAVDVEDIPGICSYVLSNGAGPALGFGQYWVLTPDAVHLGRIIISPQARSQGLGTVLLRQLTRQALAATGASSVTLRVYRDNTAALKLYAGSGFLPEEAQSNDEVLFMRLTGADLLNISATT